MQEAYYPFILHERSKEVNMKIPKPRKTSSGLWRLQLRLGGTSIPVTAATEKECRSRAALIKAEYAAGALAVPKKPKSPTLGEAMDKYISDKSNVLSPSTLFSYRGIRNFHLQSVIEVPITEVANWQELINEEAKAYSPKTVKNVWGFTAAVLSYAGMSPPRVTLPQIVRKERAWLEPDQIPVFVKALRGQPCEVGALLALHSLRRSEIYALTWDNIDLKSGLIHVCGAKVQSGKSEFTLKETNKTVSSRRTVPIMIPELTAALKAAKKSGAPLTPENPRTLGNQINSVCRRLGLPQVGVHGLRHNFASLAYHLGMPEKECQILGGWSDSQTMHKIYTHLYERDLAKHANKMTGFYKNKGAKKPSKSKPPLAKPLAK